MELNLTARVGDLMVLGQAIAPGESCRMDLGIASLFTDAPAEVPVLVGGRLNRDPRF